MNDGRRSEQHNLCTMSVDHRRRDCVKDDTGSLEVCSDLCDEVVLEESQLRLVSLTLITLERLISIVDVRLLLV